MNAEMGGQGERKYGVPKVDSRENTPGTDGQRLATAASLEAPGSVSGAKFPSDAYATAAATVAAFFNRDAPAKNLRMAVLALKDRTASLVESSAHPDLVAAERRRELIDSVRIENWLQNPESKPDPRPDPHDTNALVAFLRKHDQARTHHGPQSTAGLLARMADAINGGLAASLASASLMRCRAEILSLSDERTQSSLAATIDDILAREAKIHDACRDYLGQISGRSAAVRKNIPVPGEVAWVRAEADKGLNP